MSYELLSHLITHNSTLPTDKTYAVASRTPSEPSAERYFHYLTQRVPGFSFLRSASAKTKNDKIAKYHAAAG